MTKRERIYHNDKLRSSISIPRVEFIDVDLEKLNRFLLDEFSMWKSYPQDESNTTKRSFYSVDAKNSNLGIIPSIEGCSATITITKDNYNK